MARSGLLHCAKRFVSFIGDSFQLLTSRLLELCVLHSLRRSPIQWSKTSKTASVQLIALPNRSAAQARERPTAMAPSSVLMDIMYLMQGLQGRLFPRKNARQHISTDSMHGSRARDGTWSLPHTAASGGTKNFLSEVLSKQNIIVGLAGTKDPLDMPPRHCQHLPLGLRYGL